MSFIHNDEILEKSNEKVTSSLQFSNADALSDISKQVIEKYKALQAESDNPEKSVIETLRKKNEGRETEHTEFSNDMFQSDISRKYIEKYKASQDKGLGY